MSSNYYLIRCRENAFAEPMFYCGNKLFSQTEQPNTYDSKDTAIGVASELLEDLDDIMEIVDSNRKVVTSVYYAPTCDA